MESIFSELGFSRQDILLLYLCPICSAIGGIANWLLKYKGNFEDLNLGGETHGFGEYVELFEWVIGRALVSAALGFVLALFMVGALSEGPTSISRVLALSVIIGFSAPKLWLSQEKALLDAFDKKMKEIYSKNSKKDQG